LGYVQAYLLAAGMSLIVRVRGDTCDPTRGYTARIRRSLVGGGMKDKQEHRGPLDGVVRCEALRLYSDVVSELGGDSGTLLRHAHIDPAALTQANSVISYRSMIYLLERTARVLKCPDFGLRLAMHQGGIAVLGPLEVAMRNSSTVGEAYRYCAGHLQVYSPAVHIQIEACKVTERHFMRFEILLDRVPHQRQAVENALGLTHNAVLALSGQRFGAREAWFAHDPLLPSSHYHRYFDAPVKFGKPCNGVFFNSSDLSQPIADQNPQLYEMASSYIDMQFPSIAKHLAPRVYAMTTRLLTEGACHHAEVAARLGMHPRTLQRRLREEGTSFEAIKDDVRRDAAARYLSQPDIPLTRVAALLGYSESSVLARSCKRWFDSSPRRFRETSSELQA
jgi:AraC-like DNA-binding protein